jgi:TonB family protein
MGSQICGVFLLAVLCLFSQSLSANQQNSVQRVEVWADTLYDTDGKPVSIKFLNKEAYSEVFLSRLMAHLAIRTIRAPVVEGKPASFETGTRIIAEVIPAGAGGATVNIIEVKDMLRMKRRAVFTWPRATWAAFGSRGGSITLKCTVSMQGRCDKVDIKSDASITQEVRQGLRKVIRAYEFEPQKINGQPIEGEFVITQSFRASDSFPPPSFEKSI